MIRGRALSASAVETGADLTIAILTNGGEQDMGNMFEAVLRAVDGR